MYLPGLCCCQWSPFDPYCHNQLQQLYHTHDPHQPNCPLLAPSWLCVEPLHRQPYPGPEGFSFIFGLMGLAWLYYYVLIPLHSSEPCHREWTDVTLSLQYLSPPPLCIPLYCQVLLCLGLSSLDCRGYAFLGCPVFLHVFLITHGAAQVVQLQIPPTLLPTCPYLATV